MTEGCGMAAPPRILGAMGKPGCLKVSTTGLLGWHHAGSFRPQVRLLLCGILAAGARALPKYLLAFLARDLSASDHLGEEVVGDGFRFARAQRRARGERRHLRADLRLGHAVAAVVGVGLLIEPRHRRSRPATHDNFD